MRPLFGVAFAAALMIGPAWDARGQAVNGHDSALQSTAVAVTGVNLIDGTGAPTRQGVTVLMAAGRISCVGAAAECPVPDSARVIDGRGRWLIPGLIDAHVHLTEERGRFGPLYLAFGITSVRDMGGYPDSLVAMRVRIEADEEPGPRIFMAGRPIDGSPPAWPAVYPDVPVSVSSPDESRRAVSDAATSGSDFIKLYNGLDVARLSAAVSEAHMRGLKTTADLLPWPIARIDSAVAAGLDGMEHAIPPGDPEAIVTLLDRMVARGVALTSTLILWDRLRPTIPVGEATYQALPEALRERSREMLQRNPWFEGACRTIGEFAQRGGTVLAGTDSFWLNIYPGDLHRELELLVTCGLTPAQALAAATRNPAHWIGADNLGTIVVGHAADVVLLGADPLTDIRHTRRIELVIRGTRAWTPQELLAEAR